MFNKLNVDWCADDENSSIRNWRLLCKLYQMIDDPKKSRKIILVDKLLNQIKGFESNCDSLTISNESLSLITIHKW